MIPVPRSTVDAIEPVTRQVVPTVAAKLAPIHSRWLTEMMHGLAAALSPDADFWSGWTAVRYLNDRFDGQYRSQRILVAAIMPLLAPADSRELRDTTDAIEEVRSDLDRAGRRRNMTDLTSGLAYRLLKLLSLWFVEIQRVTQNVTEAEISPEGRRALTQLEATSPEPGQPGV